MNRNYILYGLGESNKAVKDFFDLYNIKYQIYLENEDYLKLAFDNLTVVIKSPGIFNNTAFMKFLIKNKYEILTDIGLFYHLFPHINYIGVTGTLGKTQTVLLLRTILEKKYDGVFLGGNIGLPVFRLPIKQIKYLILELSSFELEYCGSFSPQFMLYVNIYPHHLNYHETFDAYLDAKMNPLYNMSDSCISIFNEHFTPYLRRRKIKSKVITYSTSLNIENNKIYYLDNTFQIPKSTYFNFSYHIENFIGIYILLKELNVEDDLIMKYVNEFKGPSYRCEIIYDDHDIIIINDSKSTCLKSTIEAYINISSIYQNYCVILIMGGKTDLVEINCFKDEMSFLKEKENIFLYGENRFILEKILKVVSREKLSEVIDLIKLDERIVILFSPGAQSYDQFSSFIERGNVFNDLIMKKIRAK